MQNNSSVCIFLDQKKSAIMDISCNFLQVVSIKGLTALFLRLQISRIGTQGVAQFLH